VNEVLAALMAAAGGLVGGLVGVGGGILFVPALTIFLDVSQVQAESTSLLMIAIVALVGAAPVQRLDRALVFRSQAGGRQPVSVDPREKARRGVLAIAQQGVELRLVFAGQQQLEAVVARVGDALDPDQLARLRGAASRDAPDHGEAAAQLGKDGARPLRYRNLLGILRDRGQGSVDVG
jgi:hypothetical protein